MNLAQNPTINTDALFALAPPDGPFQPTSTIAPPDLQIRLQPPSSSLVLQISPPSTGPQTASLSSADSVEIQSPEALPTNGFTGFVIFPLNHVGYTQTNSTAPLTYTSLLSSTSAPPIPLTTSGADAGDFSVTAQDFEYPNPGPTNTSCPSIYVDTTNSCLITVTFTPLTTGTLTAQLSLDPATGTPTGQYVQLTGSAIGLGPYFVINASSLSMTSYVPIYPDPNFAGNVTLTLTNIGTTTIDLAASFTGANPSYMSANVSNCSSVAPEATCSFTVTFSAPTVGSYSANLLLKDAGSTFSLSVPIAATTSWFPMHVSPLIINFGNQTVGTTSHFQYFDAMDLDSYPLDHPISVSLQPGSSFTLPAGSTCSASTTEICTLEVSFAPQAVGSVTEYMTVTDETSGAQTQIELTGTGQ